MSTNRSAQPDRVFRFGPFELSERDSELRKNGVRIKLQEQPFLALVELASNAGRIVTREELQQKLWPADTFVDFEVGLNSVVRKLRQALGDDADNPHYIETLARKGYRFLVPVVVAVPDQPVEEAAAVSAPPAVPAVAAVSVATSPVADEVAATEPAADKPSTWRSRLRLWQLAAAGVALLALGVGVARWLRPAAQREVTAQRITANPADVPVTGAVISPDGKYVAYSDPTGVYIRLIDSGETRPLPLPKGFNGIPTSWFSDSTHLLVNNGEGLQHTAKIWKVSILGGDPQMLLEDAEQGAVSPDGTKLIYSRGSESARELWLADSDGRNPFRLAAQVPEHSGKITTLSSATWSPDGTRIAYIQRESVPANFPEGNQYSLYTRRADGGDARLVLQDSHIGSLLEGSSQLPLCWAPDGRLYLVLHPHPKSGSQHQSIWSIAVNQTTGEPHGKPRELLGGFGWIGGLTASRIGARLLFWRTDISGQTFISELDRNTRKMNAPKRLTFDESVSGAPVDWTADSKAVVIASTRNGKYGVYKQGLDETTSAVLSETRTAQVTVPRLSGDGNEVLYAENDKPADANAPDRLMAAPITGGMPRLILSEPGINNFLCAKPPSRVCILNEFFNQSNLFYLLDLTRGKGRLIAKLPFNNVNWGLSPDGSTLALVVAGNKGQVRFLSIDSGATKDVVVKDWPILSSADWTADGKLVLSASITPNGVPVILGIDMEGNANVLLQGDRSTPLNWVIPSPDGKYGALFVTIGESNVWMVENY